MTTIYTAGYAGWAPAQLKATVDELGATLLDIRYSPVSRRPEWTREALRTLLGARYAHVPALGNRNYRAGGPIALAAPERALPTVAKALARGPVILLCACMHAEECHRTDAAAYLADQLGAPIEHLTPPPKEAQRRAEGQIPALTLTQPWASLVAQRYKRIETRSWATSHRGPVAIHAAKGLADLGGESGLAALCAREPFRAALHAAGITGPKELPRGAVVAVAYLAGVVPVEELAGPGYVAVLSPHHRDQRWPLTPYEAAFGDYRPGRYAWLLADIQALPEPFPAKGALGLWPWTVPAEVAYAER
jgi:activating signal cointegrator 1